MKAALDKALGDVETVAEQLKVHLDGAATATRIVAAWNGKVRPGQFGDADRRIVYASSVS